MDGDPINWIVIQDEKYSNGQNETINIGAVGIINDSACIVVSFFDDDDFGMKGKVTTKDKIFAAAESVLPVHTRSAMAHVMDVAKSNLQIMSIDHTFIQWAAEFSHLEIQDALRDAAYKEYLRRSVSSVAGALASKVSSNIFLRYIIKKGMEDVVKSAFDSMKN